MFSFMLDVLKWLDFFLTFLTYTTLKQQANIAAIEESVYRVLTSFKQRVCFFEIFLLNKMQSK